MRAIRTGALRVSTLGLVFAHLLRRKETEYKNRPVINEYYEKLACSAQQEDIYFLFSTRIRTHEKKNDSLFTGGQEQMPVEVF